MSKIDYTCPDRGSLNIQNEPIYVTSPSLPDLQKLIPLLEDIWSKRYLTNFGVYHEEFEKALGAFLGTPYVSLVSNATVGLLIALRAIDVQGEVITTPFSFVATAHAIKWCGLQPVFCDIEEKTLNINIEDAEGSITNRTGAMLPVHVFGNPCDLSGFEVISEKYHLPVIYDAAHAFGVVTSGRSLCDNGDISVVSFHATKAFNTIEGGLIVSKTRELKNRVDLMRNFGFNGELNVEMIGINAKMNELQAAFGLLQLDRWEEVRTKRRVVYEKYLSILSTVDGIRVVEDITGHGNFSYLPILVERDLRENLYSLLRAHSIFARRYFFPLITDFNAYKRESHDKVFPVAEKISQQIICLPISEYLTDRHVENICSVVAEGVDANR